MVTDKAVNYEYDSLGRLIHSYQTTEFTETNETVTAILQQTEHLYGAWGAIIDSWCADNYDVGELNPIRYRGYYYDKETGLYYLQSRYYDPAVKRFVNADSLVSTGQGFIGYNMYAYCSNSPVVNSDPTGKYWQGIFEFFRTMYNLYKYYLYYFNYGFNSNKDADSTTTTKGKILNDQYGATGENFQYGAYSASENACGAIAIHNARVLMGQDDSTLSETMLACQLMGHMPLSGEIGTNPYGTDDVLGFFGVSTEPVGVDEMSNPGVYVITVYNSVCITGGLHTVALEYNGDKYRVYNWRGNGSVFNVSYDHIKQHFLCGYYLGG